MALDFTKKYTGGIAGGASKSLKKKFDFSKRYSATTTTSTIKPDLSTTEGLATYAIQQGLQPQTERILKEKEKLSFFQRLVKGLGAFNPAQAVLTAEKKGILAGGKEYFKGAISDIGSAFTGKDNYYERKTFKDVAEKLGVKNAIAKYGIGFLGDVLLDPTTYFGGTIIKSIGKGALKTGQYVTKGAEVVAPKLTKGAKGMARGIQESLGRAFIPAFETKEGYLEDVMKVVTKLETKKAKVILNNFEIMGTNTLSKSQQQELVSKLVAGKVAEFEARQAGKSLEEAGKLGIQAAKTTDPLVKKAMQLRFEKSKEIAETGKLKNPFEVYYPFLKKDTVPQFLSSAQKLKVGSEGYKKQFKNILQYKDLVVDPVEAFSRRDWEVIKDIAVREDLQFLLSKYGKNAKAFKTIDEALDAGYVPVFEKGIGIKPRSFFKTTTEEGKDVVAMGKLKTPLGYLPENEAKFLNDMINPEFTTIDMLAKSFGFDTATALFKRSVTGLFPAFHVRNFVSGIMQNFEVLGASALNPKAIAAGQRIAYKISKKLGFSDELVKVGEKYMKEKDVFKPFIDYFGDTHIYVKDFEDAVREFPLITGNVLSTESIKHTVKTLGLGEKSIFMRGARAVGQYIEMSQKATAYIVSLGQGKTMDQALKAAITAGFDYRTLTKFESKILRRIIPFYSFTRKNIELQLRTLKETPERINQIIKAIENTGGALGFETATEEEKKFLPDYIRSGYMLKMKNTADQIEKFVSSFGSPIEAFTDLFNGNVIMKVVSTMNPILKAPIEIGFGKDAFYQTDLKNIYNAKDYAKAPQFIKDLLEIKEVEKPVWGKNTFGQSVVTGTKKVYVADPIKLKIIRSLFTSRGFTFFHDVFNEDMNAFAKGMKLFTGVKLQDVDLDLQKAIKDKEQRRALTDLLERYNLTKDIEITYIPKT